MFLIKKSNKSKAKFYKNTSIFFSSKKNNKFKFFINKNPGHNKLGKITVRHKKKINKNLNVSINFSRNFLGINLTVIETIYLNKKKPYLMLVKNKYNSISYFLKPHGIFLSSKIRNFIFNIDYLKKKNININMKSIGNLIPLFFFKTNDLMFNLISNLFKNFYFCISGGTYIKVLYKSYCQNFLFVILPSKKQIKLPVNFFAVLGRNSNKNKKKHVVGLAGNSFKLGKRSSVRGVAMNPVDHPNGGRTKTNSPEKSPWGWIAKKSK